MIAEEKKTQAIKDEAMKHALAIVEAKAEGAATEKATHKKKCKKHKENKKEKESAAVVKAVKDSQDDADDKEEEKKAPAAVAAPTCPCQAAPVPCPEEPWTIKPVECPCNTPAPAKPVENLTIGHEFTKTCETPCAKKECGCKKPEKKVLHRHVVNLKTGVHEDTITPIP